MDALLDKMQASAEGSGGEKDSAKRLDRAITIFAKAPISVLRTTISKYNTDLLPAPGSDLDAHIRAGLETYWGTHGEWDSMLAALEADLGPVAEETSQWMKMAVASGNKMTETRLKELIKERGGVKALPKAKKGDNKLLKTDYLTTLVDLLRAERDNDYQKVHEALEAESARSSKSKGFGS